MPDSSELLEELPLIISGSNVLLDVILPPFLFFIINALPGLQTAMAGLEKVYALMGSRISLLSKIMVDGNAALLEVQLNNIINQFDKEKKLMLRETERFISVTYYPKPTRRIGN